MRMRCEREGSQKGDGNDLVWIAVDCCYDKNGLRAEIVGRMKRCAVVAFWREEGILVFERFGHRGYRIGEAGASTAFDIRGRR